MGTKAEPGDVELHSRPRKRTTVISSKTPSSRGTSSEHLALIERLRAVGSRHGCSPGEIAIGWTLAPAVTGAIVGARNPEQADGVMGAGVQRLTNQEKAEIEAPSEVTS